METSITYETETCGAISVSLTSEEVNRRFSKALGKLGKTAQFPGFRKGKAPVNLLKKEYGARALSEIRTDLIAESLQTVLKQENIRPFGRPLKIDIEKFGLEEGMQFTIRTEIWPRMKDLKIDDLTIKMESNEVEETEVNEHIERIRRQLAIVKRFEDRETAVGDLLQLSITGTEKGAEKELFSGTESIIIGENKFFPQIDFDSELTGLRKNAKKTFSFDFPPDCEPAVLQGKTLIFRVKVLDTSDIEIPELDQEFVESAFSGCHSVDEMRDKIRASLKDINNLRNRHIHIERIIDALVENNAIRVPDSMYKIELNRRVEQMAKYMKSSTAEVENDAELYKTVQSGAAKGVIRYMLVMLLAHEENFTVEKSDVERFADDRMMSIEDKKALLKKMEEGESIFPVDYEIFTVRVGDMLLKKNNLTGHDSVTIIPG